MTLAAALAPHGLMVAGELSEGAERIVLIAPDEPGFWSVLTASAEWADGAPDPIDRWSKRVLGALAEELGGTAIFPSDGPPYPPFYTWALATGRVFASPVSLLVHDQAGLFISFRGALRLNGPAAKGGGTSPCATCADQPCRSACPAGALTAAGYDVPKCHAFLNTKPGADCLNGGCLVRRSCPVGKSRRLPEQSAYHMRQFHK